MAIYRAGAEPGSFHGRASRGAWSAAVGLNGLIAIFVVAIPGPGWILATPWMLAVVAATTRRLHDLGHSGWLQAIPIGIIVVLVAVSLSLAAMGVLDLSDPTSPLFQTLVWIAIFSGAAFLGWLGCARGTSGPNPYGEEVAS